MSGSFSSRHPNARRWLATLSLRKLYESFNWSPRRSIPAKFLFLTLGVTAIALLIAGLSMLSYDLTVYRQTWADDLATEASILARATAPAIAFDDRPVAQRNLNALQARETVLGAGLYDRNGNLYAQYQRVGEPPLPQQLPLIAQGTQTSGDRLELTRRILHNDEFLGTILLRARYDVSGRIEAYVTIFGIVTAASLIAALILSAVLQRLITGPLNSITAIARQVIDERDYSQRAPKITSDEVGVVVEAFNKMMDEVAARTRALESSNAALKQEISTRKEAESALRASEKLYRAIGESIDYGVWVCDAEGRNTYASDSFLRLTGMTQAQCSDVGWAAALHPDDVDSTIADWRECIRTGETWYREHRIRGRNGLYHPVLARGVAIRADNGEIRGWAGINLDISRMKQTEEALRDADRRKDEFLATLAHELRNPLAPIRHATKILDTATADEQQRQWSRDVIARQVQHMSLLLEDLLDISRITRGRLELKKDSVSLESLVASAVETARPLIEAKRHSLEVKLSPPLQVEVDPLRISQSLSNLLTNAAKYTDPGGRITIIVSVSPQDVAISVQDSGIGLNAAAIAKVFDMFSQVESAVDRSQGGLGIGLALVKGLVTLHGGTVEVKSAGVGAGSTFTIRLPHSVVVPARVNLTTVGTDAAPPSYRCKILVVDDNADGARSLAMLLEVSGYEVRVARSGPEALDVGMRERPDAYILDIGMPEMNGYETARRIRREAWGKRALLVAVTGWGQHDDKERAWAAGFDHHFTKPADLETMESVLASFAKKLEPEARAATS